MLEFSPDFKEHIERRYHDLEAAGTPTAVMGVRTWMLGNQRSRGDLRGHEIDADEPQTYGGTDTAPPPLSYFLASLGFCEQTMISRWACAHDVRLEDVQVEVKGYWNRKGGHIDGIEPTGFERFRVTVEITSPDSADTVRAMMGDVERQCYVFNTLRRCARVEHRIKLNGEQVMKTVTGEAPPAVTS